MLKILKESDNPEILVITPLYIGHEIFKKTRESIYRNQVPFVWASYEGTGKHATNVQAGLDEYKKQFGSFPPYIQIIDRDIILGRKMFDRLHRTLSTSGKDVAFAYCSFEYRGYVNASFPSRPYDPIKLLQGNYISSNSMYKSEIVEEVGGFITDERFHRLSDWAMFLKLLRYGYRGVPVLDTSFVAVSSEKDISAGSKEEYVETVKLVKKYFIDELLTDNKVREMLRKGP